MTKQPILVKLLKNASYERTTVIFARQDSYVHVIIVFVELFHSYIIV